MPVTIAGSIIELAKKYGASESATAKTINEALDVLNDTLAGSSQSQCATIAQQLDAITGAANVPAYVVTFNANTGTGSQAPMACAKGSTVTLPETTTFTAPSSKAFVGWGATAAATECITTVSATEATTIYAIWGAAE